MKKLFFGALIMLSVACLMGSCSNDGNSSSATCNYYGVCDTIDFTNAEDSVYKSLIQESFDSLKLTGVGSIFQETAEVDYSLSIYAIFMCNSQAITTFKNKINAVSLSDVKEAIYDAHTDSLKNLGYDSAEELPLSSFVAHFNLRDVINNEYLTSINKTY